MIGLKIVHLSCVFFYWRFRVYFISTEKWNEKENILMDLKHLPSCSRIDLFDVNDFKRYLADGNLIRKCILNGSRSVQKRLKRWPLNFAHLFLTRMNFLLVGLCSLLFACCSLLVTFCSLLFALCSLLFARCSLFFRPNFCKIKLFWTAKKWFDHDEILPQIFSLQISEIFVTFSRWWFSNFSQHAKPFS